MNKSTLQGKRLLIVEDEYLVASDLLAVLETAGARVFGPVGDVERAVEIAATSGVGLDAAILDINLNGEMAYPVATLLKMRGVPFMFLTGYECASMPQEFNSAPCLTKPFEEKDLIGLLASLGRDDLG